LWEKEAFGVMDMAEDSQDTQSAIDLLKTQQASANGDIEVNRFFLYYLQNADDLFPVFCFFFSRMLFLWPCLVCFSSLRRNDSQNTQSADRLAQDAGHLQMMAHSNE
jgi:hypothetical protein